MSLARQYQLQHTHTTHTEFILVYYGLINICGITEDWKILVNMDTTVIL